MVETQGISLILTKKCNALCRHCGFNSGPGNSETMTKEEAKYYIGSARNLASLKMVSFTGGEPFLYYPLVYEIMSFARGLGLASEIVSNSYWASSYAEAYDRLGELREMGLVNYVTSLDDFHIEFIQMDSIHNAINAAYDLGLKVTVKTLEYESAVIKSKDIATLLNITPNDRFVLQGLTPVHEGRAKGIAGFKTDNLNSTNINFLGGCDKIIKFPAVEPTGNLFPCCGFGNGARLAGNGLSEDFYELLVRMQNNLLFNLLATAGPLEIYRRVKERMPQLQEPIFSNPCEMCNYLYGSEEVGGAVYQVMQDLIRAVP